MLHIRCINKCCQVTLSPGVEVLKVIVRICDHGCSRDSVLVTNKISPAAMKNKHIYLRIYLTQIMRYFSTAITEPGNNKQLQKLNI